MTDRVLPVQPIPACGSHAAVSVREDQPLLSIEDLSVAFPLKRSWRDVVHSVSLDVWRGEVVGLVGESGSGKTVTAMSILGLIPQLGGRVSHGTIRFGGDNLTELHEREWARLRGARIGMIFQNPVGALDPAFTVGEQIAEVVRLHLGFSRRAAWQRAVEMLDRVHIPAAGSRAHDYPYMFSGGMCQRVMIAMALACEPDLLVADEPTTALDVTVQAAILDLLREIHAERHLTTLFVSHDLGVVASICDRIAVMYAGDIVEFGDRRELLARPRHPYTYGLLSSVTRPPGARRFESIPGQMPSPGSLPAGCPFAPRCAHFEGGLCDSHKPRLRSIEGGRQVACVRAERLELSRGRS